ncbi:class I SAM-dependent methyltransferase [Paenibacillus sp. GCM10027628]|uniref:class I SAM-dependent methyltransferase n=1 Tax=Paenibacillus sp. GCM10027628 TaxID=3273413 RepID=UPI00363D3B86
MTIDFHDANNRMTYTTREADASWLACLQQFVDVTGKKVADIGCGGGIYSKALRQAGASHVTGVDFSAEMLKGASQNCSDVNNVSFVQGNAYGTGLPTGQLDVVLERALIHHLDDLESCFQEASRILKPEGMYIVQDRTPEDCLLPGDASHIRGYFFEKFPALKDSETARRHDEKKVKSALESSGFQVAHEVKLWETRQVYSDLESLSQDLMARTGRSILHQLQDSELQDLVDYILSRVRDHAPIIEKDRWTVWFCERR